MKLRKHRPARRGRPWRYWCARREAILLRAAWLDRDDRQFLRTALAEGVRPTALAGLTGRTVRAVRWRLDRLCRRVTSPAFTRALWSLRYLPYPQRQIVRLHRLAGLSVRQTADALEMSVHDVRRHLLLADGVSLRQPRPQHDPADVSGTTYLRRLAGQEVEE